MTAEEKIKIIVKALDSKKAVDVQVLKISDLTILADYFIIANGMSSTQTKSLADEVEFQMSQLGIEPSGKEGHNGSNWIILDYSDVVVHVFYHETRNYYNLEKLWADGEKIDVTEFLDD